MNIPPFLIAMAGISSAGVLIAWGINGLLRKQSAAVRHFIWLLAAISPLIAAIFLPLGLHLSVPLLPSQKAQPISFSAKEFSRFENSSNSASYVEPALTEADSSPIFVQSGSQVSHEPSTPEAKPSQKWDVNIYVLIWLAGLFAVIAKMGVDQWRITHFLNKGVTPVPPELEQLARKIRGQMGMLFGPRLVMGKPTQVPFCYGIFASVVVLPETLELDRQTIYMKHEFAHILRRDLLWMLLGRIACALCWFNPLMWMALDKVRRESEYVADDLVLSAGTEPTSYASNIVHLVQMCRIEHRPLTLAMAQSEGLPRRIECILDGSVRRQFPSTVFSSSLALATVLLVFSVICVRLVAAESPDSPTAAPVKPPYGAAKMTIRIVDENQKPLAGALVTPSDIFSAKGSTFWVNPEDGTNKPTHDIITDSKGEASIPYVLDALYLRQASDHTTVPLSQISVSVTCPNYAHSNVLLKVDQANPDIVLQTGTAITLSAVGKDGALIPNASVLVDFNDQSLWGSKWHLSGDTKTITSEPLPAGNYIFRVFTRNCDGTLSFSDQLHVSPVHGQTNASYQVLVKLARDVIGVLDATVPRPVRHGFVIAFVSPRPQKEDGQPYEEPNWTTHAEIADNGTFVLKNLPDGVINLTSFCDGFVSKESNDFDYRPICPQVFRDTKEQLITVKMVPTGTVRVHLVSESGASVEGMKVNGGVTEWLNYGTSTQMGCTWDSLSGALFMQGITVPDSKEYDYSSGFTVLTDANGDATISNLPMGKEQTSVSITNANGAHLGSATVNATIPESTVIFDVDSRKAITTLTPKLSTSNAPGTSSDFQVAKTNEPSDPPTMSGTSGLTNTADPAPSNTADALWDALDKQEKALNYRDKPELLTQCKLMMGEVNELIANYPKDNRYWKARLDRSGYANTIAAISNTPIDPVQRDKDLEEIVSAKDAPKEVAASAALPLLWDKIDFSQPTDADFDEASRLISDYESRYSDTPEVHNGRSLWKRVLQMMDKSGNKAHYETLLKQLESDPQPEVQELAKGILKREELKGKPFDLKFTAVDGSEVDLAKMKGKVILLHFWASWCGPCVGEMPNVLAAYNKYHDQGFEVIGISLDRDKDQFLKFTKDHGMVWPEYYDGKALDNAISKPLCIEGVPSMWLIDKDGILVSMDGMDDLSGQVAKLLGPTGSAVVPSPAPVPAGATLTPPAPTDAAATQIANKLDSIRIPELSFKNTSLPVVISFLNAQSKNLDPQKIGVPITLKGTPTQMAAQINMQLSDLNLKTILTIICSQLGAVIQVHDDGVTLVWPSKNT